MPRGAKTAVSIYVLVTNSLTRLVPSSAEYTNGCLELCTPRHVIRSSLHHANNLFIHDAPKEPLREYVSAFVEWLSHDLFSTSYLQYFLNRSDLKFKLNMMLIRWKFLMKTVNSNFSGKYFRKCKRLIELLILRRYDV